MNPKQKRFVQEYLIDLNATQAAIRTGYSKRTAGEQASRLLADVRIAAAVKAGQQKIAEKLEVTAEMVVRELARLGFSNMKDFAEFGPGGVTLKDLAEMDENAARCIAEVSESTSKDGGSVRFKLHDKKGALDSLARHLGMFQDKTQLSGDPHNPLHVVNEISFRSGVDDSAK